MFVLKCCELYFKKNLCVISFFQTVLIGSSIELIFPTDSFTEFTNWCIVCSRTNSGGNVSTVANIPDLLNANQFRIFWISWANNFIQVGVGSVVGLGVFLQYSATTPSPVNYLAVSGWDSPGTVVVDYGLYYCSICFQRHFASVRHRMDLRAVHHRYMRYTILCVFQWDLCECTGHGLSFVAQERSLLI